MANQTSPDVFGRQADEVRSIFGALEIVEAKTDFVVYVTAEEHETGVRGDPNRCMFSNACKRAFGSKGVLFYPTIAYVDMVDPRDSSRRIVMRFQLPPETRKQLEDFDAGIGDFQEASFILKAVRPSERLAAKAKRSRQRKRAQQLSPAERTAAKSEAATKGHQTRRTKALMGIRSGSGQIHTRDVA
jgi:hypothetical protein